MQVALGCGVPQTFRGALLKNCDTFLALAVVVVELRQTQAGRGGVHERARRVGDDVLASHLDRTAGPTQFARAVFPVLHPLEVRQDVVVGPTFAAFGGPVVEVFLVAPDEEHPVDRARSAEYPTARHRILRSSALRCGVDL